MDNLWQFLGSYWWLAFPLAGVIGGAWNAINKASQERHERRMERLRLRQGLDAGAAGGQQAQAQAAAVAQREAQTAAHAAAVQRAMADHDELNARWLEYELDVTKLIDFPLMTDVREPLMVAYLKAKRTADALRPAADTDPQLVSPEELQRFRNAVTDYRVAFDVAEAEARRVKDRDFGDEERERLALARRLITLSVDQAATPAERTTAYQRARKELDGLLSLSAETVRSMEEGARRALEASPTARPEAHG